MDLLRGGSAESRCWIFWVAVIDSSLSSLTSNVDRRASNILVSPAPQGTATLWLLFPAVGFTWWPVASQRLRISLGVFRRAVPSSSPVGAGGVEQSSHCPRQVAPTTFPNRPGPPPPCHQVSQLSMPFWMPTSDGKARILAATVRNGATREDSRAPAPRQGRS